MSITKKIFFSILLLLAIAVAIYFDWIRYGIAQGVGQMKIVLGAKPVQEVLQDATFPDSLKFKLRLVAEIRQFAFDSLGINYSDNYTTLYDQKNKPILWIVTASAPYELKAKEWEFPFLGTMAYKGFFDLEKARQEAQALKTQGFDTSVDEVGGWSTLGWFKDPILSNMLKRGQGSLANLIIHELTHGTLYVKNNVDFNENLASFVGDYGAELFLSTKYGKASKELEKYQKRKLFHAQYSAIVLRQSRELAHLYATIKTYSKEKKKQAKRQFFSKAIQELVDFYKSHNAYYSGLENDLAKINNTFYMDEKRYREKQNTFETEFRIRFNSDFKRYLAYLKEKYPSL